MVGVLALFGLTQLLTGARRTSRRGREACRGLRHSRRETAAVSKHRDDLLDQRDAARAHTAGTLESGSRWPRPSAGKPLSQRQIMARFGRMSRAQSAGRARP